MVSKETILEKIKNNASYFNQLDESLKEDVQFCCLAVKVNPFVYEFLSDKMKCHREVVYIAQAALMTQKEDYQTKIESIDAILEEIRKDPKYINKVDAKLTEDVRFCSQAVRANPDIYQDLSEKMQCHREVVSATYAALGIQPENIQLFDEDPNVLRLN